MRCAYLALRCALLVLVELDMRFSVVVETGGVFQGALRVRVGCGWLWLAVAVVVAVAVAVPELSGYCPNRSPAVQLIPLSFCLIVNERASALV